MNFSKKLKESFFQQNSFAIYGLGVTGRSVINFFSKRKVDDFFIWDDNKTVRDVHGINKKYKEKYFAKILEFLWKSTSKSSEILAFLRVFKHAHSKTFEFLRTRLTEIQTNNKTTLHNL